MGFGTSSGSQSAVVTPEQTKQNQLTNQMLESYIPVLQGTLTGAQNTYNTVQPYVNQGALNAFNQAGASQNVANGIASAANQFAAQQAGFSNTAENAGSAGANQAAGALGSLGGGGASTGLQGTSGVAGQMANYGSALTGSGANALTNLFSPQYEQQQVMGALAPAEYEAQQANMGMNAAFAGAGEGNSTRNAIANQQTQALNNQMLGSVAAQTEAGIQQQQYNAANALLGAGSTQLGNAGNLYSSLYGTGTQGIANAGNISSNVLNAGVNAGNTAVGAGQLGNAANASALSSAQAQSAAAQAPLNAYNQYASTIFGIPSSTNTANFTGTQGQNTSGKGIGGAIKTS